MIFSFRTLAIIGLVLSVGACSWNDSRSKTLGGAVGAVVGGIVGSKLGGGTGRTVAIVMGATLGAMWGQDIAEGMTDLDKKHSQRTANDTLEYGKSGEQVSWSNPDSGNFGTVTPNESYTNDKGEDCRQFETTVNVEGENRTTIGTACRTTDGEWQVIDAPEAST